MKHHAMLASITQYEDLSRRFRDTTNQPHEHRVSFPVLREFRNHRGQGQLTESRTWRWIPESLALKLDGKHLHVLLIFSFYGKKRWSHEPVKDLRKPIFSIWGRRQTKYVFWAHFEQGLTLSLIHI